MVSETRSPAKKKVWHVVIFRWAIVGYALDLTRIFYLQKPCTPLHTNRHLFCTSKAEDEDKPTVTVPFSTLRRVIETHQKQQGYVDINRDIKKRLRDEGDLDVAWEIERLKKPRQC